jgi:RNA polymerase sigma factor (sigma-70 family)
METLSDKQLIIKIQENHDYLSLVYKKCKSYSILFMRKVANGSLNDYELEDLYHDAILVLYEKIVGGNFELTASLQTYLNSVCRFQLLSKFDKQKKWADFDSNSHNEEDHEMLGFNGAITDFLEEVEDSKETQFTAIETALLKMKAAGGHCYELLTLFWYHKKSMNELTTEFGYNNPDTTKQQKARCQKRLEKMAYNELNS